MALFQNIFAPKRPNHQRNDDDIIRNFGVVLEATASESISNSNLLPYSKKELSDAYFAVMNSIQDSSTIETLKVGYLHSGKFLDLNSEEQNAITKWDDAMSRVSQTLEEVRAEALAIAEYGDLYNQLVRKRGTQTESLMQELRERGYA